MYGGLRMSKKIFMLLFLMLALISVSAVSAADLNDNNETIVSFADAEALAFANDIDAIDDLNEDVSDGDDVALEKDAKSVAVVENNEIYGAIYEDSSLEIPVASDDNDALENENGGGILKETFSTWYVDANAAPGGDGKSEDTAFQTLKNALDKARDNDIIKIAAGTYTGNNNTRLAINKNLTFEKYGDGEAIFDAQSKSRIWGVDAETINIKGLTFKNGKAEGGGAIMFRKVLSNSIINATFINNTAFAGASAGASAGGGAILFTQNLYNVSIYGEFIGNKAEYGGAIRFEYECNSVIINAAFTNNTAYYGGAISFYDKLTDVNISGIFTGNQVRDDGGAISANTVYNSIINATFINNRAGDQKKGDAIEFSRTVRNVDISGKFINNKRNSVIYIGNSSDNVIHDSIFINNNGIRIKEGSIQAIDNWFGNNATNYNETPNVGSNLHLQSWLFLNATANPSEIELYKNSTIVFKLYSYNVTSKETRDYDASKMNVVLNLTRTLGELDKTATSLGEEITYTAKEAGDASITGTFETLSYTVSLKNNKIPTELDLSTLAPSYYNPSTSDGINGTVKNKMTGYIIKKGSVDLYLNEVFNQTVDVNGYDGSVYFNLGVLDAGNYSVNARYHDDSNEFMDSELNWNFEIKKALTAITVYNAPDKLIIGDGTNVVAVLAPSEAGNLTYSSNDTSVVSIDENGNVVAVGAGTANITISFAGNKNYAADEKQITVTVSKISTNITIQYDSISLNASNNVSAGAALIPDEAGNLTYNTNDTSVANVIEGRIFAVGAGKAVITVSFAGNEKYAAAESKKINVTVTANDASVNVTKTEYNLFVGEQDVIIAIPTPDGLKVSFSTDEDDIVSIDENGTITALKGGNAIITVSVGDDKVFTKNSTLIRVTVNKIKTQITASAITATYNVNKNLVITLKDDKGNALSGLSITVNLNGAKTYATNKNGQVIINVAKLVPKAYTVKISFAGNSKYIASSANVKVTVKKAKSKIVAKKKTFKKAKKTKKYTITLKSGKTAIKKVSVTLKIKGKKIIKAKTNKKGKATFKIKKLTKKGTYKATIKFKGNKYYNKATKKVKIKIK